jgi:hypothetical protein
MSTAAKIITGIWAHRLSTTLEERGVLLEDVQEGFRPDRSTKRQVLRLLNCINAAKRKGNKLIVAFLDFENYFNAIGLECVFVFEELCLYPQCVFEELCLYPPPSLSSHLISAFTTTPPSMGERGHPCLKPLCNLTLTTLSESALPSSYCSKSATRGRG